jgi:Xaa-Pro aminopeptidase
MKKILLVCFSVGLTIAACAQKNVMTAKNEATSKEVRKKMILAQQKLKELLDVVEKRGLIVAGKSESALSAEIVKLAKDLFGTEEHWHKKIVRAGVNTLVPYNANPPDRVIQKDDIVFIDFGPNFEGWETDMGRTYVLGNNPQKLKMKKDVEAAWVEANAWYAKQTKLTGAEYFNYAVALAKRHGYEFGGDIAGHIIGRFPHEQPDPMDLSLDVHPGNSFDILGLDKQGNKRNWVLEIHFVDRPNGIGGFYEELLK